MWFTSVPHENLWWLGNHRKPIICLGALRGSARCTNFWDIVRAGFESRVVKPKGISLWALLWTLIWQWPAQLGPPTGGQLWMKQFLAASSTIGATASSCWWFTNSNARFCWQSPITCHLIIILDWCWLFYAVLILYLMVNHSCVLLGIW